jgi:hypothetical protein
MNGNEKHKLEKERARKGGGEQCMLSYPLSQASLQE